VATGATLLETEENAQAQVVHEALVVVQLKAVIYAKHIRKVNVTVVVPVAFCMSKIETPNEVELEDFFIQTRRECAPLEIRVDFRTSKKLKALRDD